LSNILSIFANSVHELNAGTRQRQEVRDIEASVAGPVRLRERATRARAQEPKGS